MYPACWCIHPVAWSDQGDGHSTSPARTSPECPRVQDPFPFPSLPLLCQCVATARSWSRADNLCGGGRSCRGRLAFRGNLNRLSHPSSHSPQSVHSPSQIDEEAVSKGTNRWPKTKSCFRRPFDDWFFCSLLPHRCLLPVSPPKPQVISEREASK
ncbi:hypothetical protein DL95DRAFT_385455 [Leptodontidium sp. 2 PMI_412]|nr:hypothetical protein DL95DRAFT_385455 [Leptodontidium sp. 2 PMI_412]